MNDILYEVLKSVVVLVLILITRYAIPYLKQKAENSLNAMSQYTERTDGSLQGKVVSSVSAGNESISYAVGKSADTAISNAIKDLQSKDMAVYQFITSRSSGVSDANGVNLLFGGRYPYRVEV